MPLVTHPVEELVARPALYAQRLGKGRTLIAWNPNGTLLAAVGMSRVVQLFAPDVRLLAFVEGRQDNLSKPEVDSQPGIMEAFGADEGLVKEQQLKNGAIVGQIVPPSPSQCVALEWSKDGKTLVVVQDNSRTIVLWRRYEPVEYIDLGVKDIVLATWSPCIEAKGEAAAAEEEEKTRPDSELSGALVAFATSRGKVLVYNSHTKTCDVWEGASSKGASHSKRRIEFLQWIIVGSPCQLVLAYPSEGSNLVLSSPKGQLMDKVNVKGKLVDCKQFLAPFPDSSSDSATSICKLCLSFEDGAVALYSFQVEDTFSTHKSRSESASGGTMGGGGSNQNVSGSASRRNRSSSASSSVIGQGPSRNVYKLSFPSSHGKVRAFEWLDSDHLIFGFSNGAIILLSVNLDSIGQEKGRTRYLRRSLQHMVCDARASNILATSGDDGNIQIFDVRSWNLFSFQWIPEEAGRINHLAFSRATNTLSVSTESGTVLNYGFPQPKVAKNGSRSKRRANFFKTLRMPVHPLWFLFAMLTGALFAVYLLAIYFSTDVTIILRAILDLVECRKLSHAGNSASLLALTPPVFDSF